MGFFKKISLGLKKTRMGMMRSIRSMLGGFTTINEDMYEELEELLIMGDVGVNTAEYIVGELRQRVQELSLTDPNRVPGILHEIITDLLGSAEGLNINTKPSVILVIGVNGVGKTTSIGKIAAQLRKKGKKVIVAAADTFRAAAIDQLKIWAERAKAEMVAQPEGSDPAAVVFDAITAAKARKADVIICDTAGRLHNKKNLMNELAKINRIIDRELPGADKEVLLVVDATTGQNAINQAKAFKEAAGLTGIILTKLDGTAKGGIAIAIRNELGLPVRYIGLGEQIDDMQPFDAKEFVDAIFG